MNLIMPNQLLYRPVYHVNCYDIQKDYKMRRLQIPDILRVYEIPFHVKNLECLASTKSVFRH